MAGKNHSFPHGRGSDLGLMLKKGNIQNGGGMWGSSRQKVKEGGRRRARRSVGRNMGDGGLVRKVNSLTGAPHTMPCSLELSENGGGATF